MRLSASVIAAVLLCGASAAAAADRVVILRGARGPAPQIVVIQPQWSRYTHSVVPHFAPGPIVPHFAPGAAVPPLASPHAVMVQPFAQPNYAIIGVVPPQAPNVVAVDGVIAVIDHRHPRAGIVPPGAPHAHGGRSRPWYWR